MPHPEKRDLDLARTHLEAFLARGRPGAEDLSIANLRAPSNTGFSSETLLFEVHWRERGAPRTEELVARIEPRGFNVFPSYDLTVQFRVLEALAKTNVPVPAVRAHDWSDDTLGAPFYTMEFLDGWVPSDNPPMHAAGKLAEEMTPAEREQVWWSGVEAMCRVHDVDPEKLGLGFLDECKWPQATRSEPQASGVDKVASDGATSTDSRAEGSSRSRSTCTTTTPISRGASAIGRAIRCSSARSAGCATRRPPASRWRCAGATRGSPTRSTAASSASACSTGRWFGSATRSRTPRGGWRSTAASAKAPAWRASRACPAATRRSRTGATAPGAASTASTTTRCSR
ncbi:MAG: phosphotransferase family protein [Deltaproteobacteria bacterium]|nr:MAG: phosphotransferase family protein [Deltaproteobacteria bacterium]